MAGVELTEEVLFGQASLEAVRKVVLPDYNRSSAMLRKGQKEPKGSSRTGFP